MPQPSKGTRLRLNLRVAPGLYRQVAALALAAKQPLNDYVISVLTDHVRSKQ